MEASHNLGFSYYEGDVLLEFWQGYCWTRTYGSFDKKNTYFLLGGVLLLCHRVKPPPRRETPPSAQTYP